MRSNTKSSSKAFLYGRVSDIRQVKGTSISIQNDEEKAEEIANRFNVTWSGKVYNDAGKSAFNGDNLKHGELRILIDDIHRGHIKRNDIIILRSLDRFSRADINKAVSEFTSLLNQGIRFFTTIDNRMYSDDSKDLNPILATLSFRTANEESYKKSALMNAYVLKRVAQFRAGERGVNGFPFHIGSGVPFHCKLLGTDKNRVVAPHHERFEIARKIVSLALKGWGITKLSNWLEQEHDITRTRQSLSNYLKSPALHGTLILNVQDRNKEINSEYKIDYHKTKVELEDYYPQVCSLDEFNALQYLREQRKKTTRKVVKHQTLLSGKRMLFCADCSSSMASNYVKGKGPIYYVCINDKCNNLEQIRVLNAVVAEVVTGDVHRLSSSVSSDNELSISSLEVKVASKSQKLKEYYELVLEEPKIYGRKLLPYIADIEEEISELNTELDLAKGANFTSTAKLKSFDEMSAVLCNQKDKLVNGSIEDNILYGDILAGKIIDRINVSSNGLVTIKFMIGKSAYIYFPKQNKTKGRRMGVQLYVHEVADSFYHEMKADKAFSKVTFTVDEIKHEKHVCLLEDVLEFSKLFSDVRTQLAEEKVVQRISEILISDSLFVLNKLSALGIGLSERQWQKHKKYIYDWYKRKNMIVNIKYLTAKKHLTSVDIITKEENSILLGFKDKELKSMLSKNLRSFHDLA